MYTVRVQHSDLSHTLACAQYTTTRGEPRVLTLYATDGPLQGQTPVLTLAVEKDVVVFIMNADGNTIDTLRARPARPR